jgi:hypothetical protein
MLLHYIHEHIRNNIRNLRKHFFLLFYFWFLNSFSCILQECGGFHLQKPGVLIMHYCCRPFSSADCISSSSSVRVCLPQLLLTYRKKCNFGIHLNFLTLKDLVIIQLLTTNILRCIIHLSLSGNDSLMTSILPDLFNTALFYFAPSDETIKISGTILHDSVGVFNPFRLNVHEYRMNCKLIQAS